MMIIEIFDPKLLAERNRAIAMVKEAIGTNGPSHSVSYNYKTDEFTELRDELHKLETMDIPSKEFYIPEQINIYQKLKLQGLEWGQSGEQESSGQALQPLHNARIALANVDHVKMYPLEGEVVSRLRCRLIALWGSQRLMQALDRNNDPELRQAFVTYCEDMSEVLKTIDEIKSSSIVTEISSSLIEQLGGKADEIADIAAAAIESIFERYEEAQAARDEEAKEQAEFSQFIDDTEKSLNEKLSKRLLLDKAIKVIFGHK